jgi:LuxR family maltose regulon positive regulatory protein
MLAEAAVEFVREHRTEKVIGVAPLALGVSLAARDRPEEALPLIECGVALSRTFGQPIQLVNALLGQAPVLRALGEHKRAADVITEARSILESCPDPGILAGRLAALDRSPQIRHVRSGDQELTQRELRVLRLLHGDLSERDIGRELYVSHSTVHSHVRAIYRKLAVRSRADALERGRQLGLLQPAPKE